jgi:hypothetical protein
MPQRIYHPPPYQATRSDRDRVQRRITAARRQGKLPLVPLRAESPWRDRPAFELLSIVEGEHRQTAMLTDPWAYATRRRMFENTKLVVTGGPDNGLRGLRQPDRTACQ